MLIIWKTGFFIYCIHVPLEHVTFVSIYNTFVYTICISFFYIYTGNRDPNKLCVTFNCGKLLICTLYA